MAELNYTIGGCSIVLYYFDTHDYTAIEEYVRSTDSIVCGNI